MSYTKVTDENVVFYSRVVKSIATEDFLWKRFGKLDSLLRQSHVGDHLLC